MCSRNLHHHDEKKLNVISPILWACPQSTFIFSPTKCKLLMPSDIFDLFRSRHLVSSCTPSAFLDLTCNCVLKIIYFLYRLKNPDCAISSVQVYTTPYHSSSAHSFIFWFARLLRLCMHFRNTMAVNNSYMCLSELSLLYRKKTRIGKSSTCQHVEE